MNSLPRDVPATPAAQERIGTELTHRASISRGNDRAYPVERAVVAIDLGGTIEDSWQSKREWFAARGFDIGDTPIPRDDVIVRIGGQSALYDRMRADVYSAENVLSRRPVPGAASALAALSPRFRIVVVSTRDESYRLTTSMWLQRHGLNHLIERVALLGNHGVKLDWCERNDVHLLIDDDIRHLAPLHQYPSVERLYFGSSLTLCPGMRFRSTWADVAALLTDSTW